MHLLLIEDDLDLGSALQQALRGAGFTSEWLRTAQDARRFAALAHHDCVLLDLTLPDGHGLALLRSWRKQGMTTPLIVITASDALGDRLAGLDEGADDFIVKPFAVEELISRVRAVTRRVARPAAAWCPSTGSHRPWSHWARRWTSPPLKSMCTTCGARSALGV